MLPPRCVHYVEIAGCPMLAKACFLDLAKLRIADPLLQAHFVLVHQDATKPALAPLHSVPSGFSSNLCVFSAFRWRILSRSSLTAA
jgi:hypothetical protein